MSKSADVFIKELNALQGFLVAQQGSQDASKFTASLTAHAENLAKRLAGLHLKPEDGGTICQVLREGPWGADLLDSLASAVSSAVLHASSSSTRQRRELQNVESFFGYFSRSDLQELKKVDNPLLAKLDLVALRCWKVGLVCPSEKAMGQVLMAARQAGLDAGEGPAEWLACLQRVKKLIKKQDGKVHGERVHVIDYPLDPGQLNPQLFAAAYSDADPPEALPEHAALTAERVPLRSTHKGVRGQSTQLALRDTARLTHPKAGVASSSAGCAGSGFMPPEMMQQWHQWQQFQAFQQAQAGHAAPAQPRRSGSGENLLHNLQIFGPGGTPARAPSPPRAEDANTPSPPPAQHVVPAPQGAPPLQLPIVPDQEDNESPHPAKQAALVNSVKGQPKPKAAPSTEATAKKKCKAKPKGKGGLKRLAAAEPAGWRIEVKTRTYGASKGQTDKFWLSPEGRRYRSLREAMDAGFVPAEE